MMGQWESPPPMRVQLIQVARERDVAREELRTLKESLIEAFDTDDVSAIRRAFDHVLRAAMRDA